MGIFDSVMIRCLKCGSENELQSKADEDAYLRVFTIDTAPRPILADIIGDAFACDCGQILMIDGEVTARVVAGAPHTFTPWQFNGGYCGAPLPSGKECGNKKTSAIHNVEGVRLVEETVPKTADPMLTLTGSRVRVPNLPPN